jgi:deazaflavin-dependent oxidoreductase (nitroreductase family)
MNIVERVGGSKPFLRIAPKIVPPIDRFVHRVSGGRMTMTQLYLPTILLTTTGRKSGEPRTAPLAAFPDGDRWIVVGSNFGRENHPAWTHNLLANPHASLVFKGTTYQITARMLEPEEQQEMWPQIIKMWPNFNKYSEYAGGRELRVFSLDRR